MVVNLSLNTQNLSNSYTDTSFGENTANLADNISSQSENGLGDPIDSISLSYNALNYLEGNPPAPPIVPEEYEVIERLISRDDPSFLNWLNNISNNNDLFHQLQLNEQNQSVILTQDKEPNTEGTYTQEDLDKIKQRILELRAQNAGKDARLDAVYVWTLNLIENANSKRLGVLDKLLLDRLVDFAQEHAKPYDLLNIMRDFLAAVYFGIKDKLNGPFNGPFEQPKPVGPDL